MNGVQTRFKCKLDVKRCKRFVFPPSSLLPRSNALKTKAIRYFQTDQTLTRIVSSPLPKAATIIDEIAQIMLTDTSKKYLITGCTDAKGSSQYNMELSQKRADAVVNALIKQGVPNKMLKAKGVGAKISYASQNAPNEIREGDRKIIVQIVTNMDYWNYIP